MSLIMLTTVLKATVLISSELSSLSGMIFHPLRLPRHFLTRKAISCCWLTGSSLRTRVPESNVSLLWVNQVFCGILAWTQLESWFSTGTVSPWPPWSWPVSWAPCWSSAPAAGRGSWPGSQAGGSLGAAETGADTRAHARSHPLAVPECSWNVRIRIGWWRIKTTAIDLLWWCEWTSVWRGMVTAKGGAL